LHLFPDVRSAAPILALAALVAAFARPCVAQAPDRGPLLRALALDAGVLATGGARSTAAFGATLDLAPGRGRGRLRLGLSGWTADAAGHEALRGRDLSLLWLFRTGPLAGAGWRFFAGAGPALSRVRLGDTAPAAPARAAAAAQAGIELPLAPRSALALELRLGALIPTSGPVQRSLRLALRLRPGAARALIGGEPRPPAPPTLQAQPAPPTALAAVLAGTAGVLAPVTRGGGLRLEPAAFAAGGTELTRIADARLAQAGRTLRRIGAQTLRVIIYSPGASSVAPDPGSLRAVAVARALARGGFPRERIALEVAPPLAGEGGAGRILAGTRCVSGCVAQTTRPPR